MVSVFWPKMIEAIAECPACSLEEVDNNRIVLSIVYKGTKIFGLDVVRLVAKDIQVERSCILHAEKRCLKFRYLVLWLVIKLGDIACLLNKR